MAIMFRQKERQILDKISLPLNARTTSCIFSAMRITKIISISKAYSNFLPFNAEGFSESFMNKTEQTLVSPLGMTT